MLCVCVEARECLYVSAPVMEFNKQVCSSFPQGDTCTVNLVLGIASIKKAVPSIRIMGMLRLCGMGLSFKCKA